MSDFFHGVQGTVVQIEGTSVRAIRSSVVGMVVTARRGPVNTPTLIFGNLTQAATMFGLSDGSSVSDAYQNLKAVFDQLGTLVVVVNVCDPTVHFTAVASELVSLDYFSHKGKLAHTDLTVLAAPNPTTISSTIRLGNAHSVALPAGVTVTGVKTVKGGTVVPAGAGAGQWSVTANSLNVNDNSFNDKDVWVTWTAVVAENTDFTVDKVTGTVSRVLASTKIPRGADITIGYSYVDPSKVDADDIIGAPQDGATKATGIFALRAAATYPGVMTKPRLLIAPGFSSTLAVATELDNAASVLNGRAFVDAGDVNYEAAIDYASNFAGELNRVTVGWPQPKIDHPTNSANKVTVSASTLLAGSQSRVDKVDGGGDPHVSLSNKQIKGIQGLTYAVDHTITNIGETAGESTAQFLNENNVVTFIHEDGWRAFGNTQANGQFLCVQRMADYVLESMVLALIWAIDKSISGPALLDQILTVGRHFLRRLEARGSLVANPNPSEDNDIWFPSELNTPDVVSQGTAYMTFRMNPPPPLQRLIVTGQLTNTFLAGAFAQNSNSTTA